MNKFKKYPPNSIDALRTVLIDTTSFCNLRCSMCPHKDMKRTKGRMEWSLIKKILDEVASINKDIRVWLVFFGEALLLKNTTPSIFDIITYAKKIGLRNVVLNTNANLLDRKTSERLIQAGLDSMYIGIDAFSDETYRQVRVGGDYQQVVQNVLDLIEVNKAAGEPLAIQVQFVEMDINKNERAPFVDFWTKKGVDVKIRQKLSWSGLMNSGKTKNTGQRHPCYWIMNSISITDTGDVATCAADPEARFIAGNVKTQSIKKIWEGKMGDLRRQHIEGEWDHLPYPCNECQDWKISYQDKIIHAPQNRPINRIIKKFLKTIRRVVKGAHV